MKNTFSLVIPTRNRQRYAIHAIESALKCRCEDLQIVVSDNSDSGHLLETITSRGWASSVTYIQPDKVLSMRDNWEFALDIVDGDYVTFIGDDDAVMPDCFEWARPILARHDPDVLNGGYSIFKWDDYPFPGRQNYLQLSFGNNLTIWEDPQDALRAALSYKRPVGTGPGLYYGFVKLSFLKHLREKRGRWIVDEIPDFDSGYAALMYARKIVIGARNVFVSGHGAKSNSGSIRFDEKFKASLQQLAYESSLKTTDLLLSEEPSLRCNQAVVVACQLRMLPEFQKALDDELINVNKVGAWNYLAKGVSSGYENLSFPEALNALKRLAESWQITDSVKFPEYRSLGQSILQAQGPKFQNTGSVGQNGELDRLVVNGNRMGWSSIQDAVKFIHSLQPSVRNSKQDIQICSEDPIYAFGKRLRKIHVLIQLKETQEALNECRLLARDHPYQEDAITLYIDLLMKLGMEDAAKIEASRLLSFSSNERMKTTYGYLVADT